MNKNLKDLEKTLYVFSRIKEILPQVIKEFEEDKTNYNLTEDFKKNFDFSLDGFIDFFFPNSEVSNYLKAMKNVEWPIAIKFLSQFLEGYLEAKYSKEKTVEEVVKDFIVRKFFDYIKG
ncbi:MAG: hypothetical protein QXQ69_03165 [Candidatus Aenigmatarchaeota archaeon]